MRKATKAKKIGLICVILLLLAALAFVLIRQLGDDSIEADTTSRQPAPQATTDKNKNKADPLKPVAVKYEQLSEQKLQSKVNYLNGTKQYAEAEKLIQNQKDLDKSKPKLSLLALVQQAQKKNDAAAATAGKIAALGDLQPGEFVQVAQYYEAAGNKEKAVEYYTQAIDSYNTAKMGSYQATVQRLQAKIDELQ